MMPALLILALFAQSLQDVYNAANTDMQARRWADAAQKYEQILKEDPAHIPTMFQLAVCLTNLENFERAETLYRDVLSRDANIFEARINFALLLEKMGNVPAALEEIAAAVALRPDDPEVRMTAASLLLSAGELDRAYAELLVAEEKGIRTVDLYLLLTDAELRRNDSAKAALNLEKALELDPSNRDLQRRLGAVYGQAGEFEKVVAILRPLLPETRIEVAFAHFALKNYVEAAVLFEELVRLEPSNSDYLFMLGKSNMESRRFAEAIPPLVRALELKPADVEVRWTLGYSLYLHEDWPRAIEILRSFSEVQPRHAFVHFLLATAYDNLQAWKEAVVHYNRFLELDDGSSDVRSFQARARAQTLERRLER
jgi:tetratricopeptide (TPR) repeat protein